VRATPAAPELAKPILSEKPRVDATSLETLTKTREDVAESLNKDLESFRDKVIQDRPQLTSRSLLDMAKDRGAAADVRGDAAPGSAGVPGFSDLDQLLGQAGGLKKGTGPILMPTDLLFDYDKAELRPGAVGSLRKLGKLIQRNPRVTFSIEGHTDSFGPDDYNLFLSEQRAEAVKQWLVAEMNIDPSKIRTRGFGKSKLIAPDGGSIEEQQINRRVEIVIQFPDGG
jgi:outer membrane protein OmpA-like peptidoglycan-associated protein